MIAFQAAGLFLLLAVSASFSLVEAAITALSALRIKKLSFVRPGFFPFFREWIERPHRLLTVLMVGNNLVNVAFSSLAAVAALPLNAVLPPALVSWAVWVLVSFLVLVVGDIVPKIVGRVYRERVVVWTLPVLWRLVRLSTVLWGPVDWALRRYAPLLHRVSADALAVVSVEEIQQAASESSAAGHLSKDSGDMLHRALALTLKTAGDIARPAAALESLPLELLSRPNGGALFLDLLVETGRTRVPVTRAGRPVGYVNVFDVLREGAGASGDGLESLVRPLRRILPDVRAGELLDEFRRTGDPLALVVTLDGQVRGFLTLEDLLEQIVGNILDEYDREEAEGEVP